MAIARMSTYKTVSRFLFLLLTAVILTSILLPATGSAQEIFVGGTGYWTPYCFKSPEHPDKLSGFTIDILKNIFNKDADKLRIMALPWKRCLKMLDHGQLDLVLDGSRDSKRLQKYLFSDEIYKLDNVFFYNKNKFPTCPQINNVNDLSQYTIGGVTGFYYKIYPFPESKVQNKAVDIKGMISMLNYDRFDLGIGFKQVVISNAKLNNFSLYGIGHTPIPDMKQLRFYIFGNHTYKTEQLIKRINTGLNEMKKDGTINKLRKKYGLPTK